jgi:chromosome segregation protein
MFLFLLPHSYFMQLKKIEIKGFKSFGDKVTIHFGEGITGIVGPNGSGKSNVVDAIRWVLGEQSSKALRSDKMENVIFNGTKKRKALQMAEVLMTFQNNRNLLSTEYGEVTIGRRYYRAGEGEYLLNGVSCRLKDIHNLFMDTGVSSDSYAIIELKMVDEILNDKDGSRRELFEEAAGIAKFKVRRKETLKKLEETDADISRVDDLLAEILKNMRQLDRQAKQARQYLDLKEQYKKFSLALAQKAIQSRSLQISQFEVFLQHENDKRTQFEAQIATLNATLEAQKLVLLEEEKKISQQQKQLNEVLDSIRKKENEINLKNERFKSLNDRKNALQEEISRNKEKFSLLKDNLQALETEKQNLSETLETFQDQLEESQKFHSKAQQDYQSLQNQQSQLQNRLKNKQLEYNQSLKKRDDCQLQIEVLSGNISGFEKEKETTQAQLSELKEQAQNAQYQIESLTDELESLQDREHQNKLIQQSIQTKLDELNRQKSSAMGDLQAKNKELSVATALSQNLEAYSQSIKYLKSQPNSKHWAFLSDILDCQEPYRAAVEAFLEDKLEFLVTQDRHQALEAIAELAARQKGRAHFVFDSLEPDTEKKTVVEGLTPFASVLKVDSRYLKAVERLFDRVYIVETGYEFGEIDGILIDKNGQWISHANHIYGGQILLGKAKKIGRFFDLQHLKEQVESLNEQIETLEDQIEEQTRNLKTSKDQSFEQALTETKRRLDAQEKQLLTFNTKIEQLSIYLGNSENKNKQIQDKIDAFKTQKADFEPKIEELKIQTEAIEDELEAAERALELSNRTYIQAGAVLNERKIEFNKYSDKLQGFEREFEYKNKDYYALHDSLQRSESALNQTIEALEVIARSSDQENADLPEYYQQKNKLEDQIKALEKSYFERKNSIIENENLVSENRGQKDKCQQSAAQLSEKINAAKLELMGIKERMSVEFEIELNEETLSQAQEGDYTEADLRGQVAAIKAALEKFGPINFTAIEAYNEIKERHDFIQAQKNDLLKAKETLAATITEIETIAKENFLNTFELIRANFVDIFRSLFAQEDTCDLVLVNPLDPLGSSIDIIAKPKGKKPLTINQLSGGEKTLTATALLFAIYLIKPAPFCVFDEVDAPLDDANIDKFNNIIRKFSDRSQFIIVTHNKRTMACTDVMYGITMIDQVSTVVPVDLRVAESV